MIAPLRSWLKAEGMWWAPQRHEELTHVFLDGGKASVPHARREEFWRAYARCLSAGQALRVVERIDPGRFHMFLDIDVATDVGRAAERIVLDVVVPTASALLDASHAVVCGKVDPAAKPGFHVIWPGLVVDRDAATCVVSECIARLPEHAAWLRRALDTSVYGGSGLRMVFSQKKPEDPATDAYVPVQEWKEGGWAAVDWRSDIVGWLRCCSLRPPPTADGGPRKNEDREPKQLAACSPGDDFDPPSPYQPCRVTAVRATDRGRIFHTTSRFCANVGRCHKSNHVYFIVSARGAAYQLCHDPECRGFRCRVSQASEPTQKPPLQQRMSTAGEVVARQLQALLGGT